MSRKLVWNRVLCVLLVIVISLCSCIGWGTTQVQAAAGKSLGFVRLVQSGKNVTKKTIKMKSGAKRKLTVKAKADLTKKNLKYASSNKKIVSVDKNGTLLAKKSGTARITVTVTKKGYKTKKAWLKVSVEEAPSGEDDAGENEPSDSSVASEKILVAYFSWSGTSERIAKNIINQTKADSFQIERETPYSDDYNTVAYGEAQTEAETNARPPIKNPPVSLDQYDKIILCYPIWWHTAPMTVGTFLERYDLTGKSIYPISQSASMDISQYEQSVDFIRECAERASVEDGVFTKDNNIIREYVENTVLK